MPTMPRCTERAIEPTADDQKHAYINQAVDVLTLRLDPAATSTQPTATSTPAMTKKRA
jgi:hypothetical protein